MKLFISYSHKDESFMEEFEEHLSQLKRNKIISLWHDRKLVAGGDWKGGIDSNLESSDVVILLISPSFLASDYCCEIELAKALEMHDSSQAVVVPIVIRECDWTEGQFSKLQALPKDAKAVNKWEDRDSAWTDAVKGLKRLIEEFVPKEKLSGLDISNSIVSVKDSMLDWLDDTEISLTHRRLDNVKLSDIYISPDIRVNSYEKDEREYLDSDYVVENSGYYLISGEEQQGKTSFLKNVYKKSLCKEILPIYVNAKDIKKSDPADVIGKSYLKQYDGSFDDAASIDTIILIDNLELIALNDKFTNTFLDNLKKKYEFIVITCQNSFEMVASEIPSLDNYFKAEILGLGNVKREEVVKKWISLGIEESIDDSDLYRECDELKNHLDTVLKKNIVPGKPIYILMLLQMFEANAKLNVELTSYGHCYQQLIYQAFDKAKIPKEDFDKYLNVLTEMAWVIFENKGALNSYELENFFNDYSRKYLTVSSTEVLNKLISHSILKQSHSGTEFKYPYIYYFFVAKKIAESYSDNEDIKKSVSKLLASIHREDFANILVFITHHTKDSWVLDEISRVLSGLFEDYDKATLETEKLSFMSEFMNSIPKLVMEQREISQERKVINEHLDVIDRADSDFEEDEDMLDALSNINKTFKGMEIAGQIIRNRHSILTRDSLSDIAESGLSTGLRFLEYFINISDSAKNEIIKIISSHLSESPELSDFEIQSHAKAAYLHLTYGVINGVVRKISSAIGSKEAFEIYDALEEKENSPAYTLIKQAIEFKFNRNLSIRSVEKTAHKLRNNPVCFRILKELVIQQTYMFPVKYTVKQQLSELLDLSVDGQRQMDKRLRAKG